MPSDQSDSISKFSDQYIKGSIVCLDIHLKKIIQIKMNSHSKYNLSAQPPKSQRQSIFMVKLTESAELCLENYLLHQEELKCPLIHFENDYNGKIIIPSEASKSEDNIYHFNIKNEPSENLDINMQINGSEIKVFGAVKKKLCFFQKLIHSLKQEIRQSS